ncbi:hypothetical protein KKC13_05945 [bacterium]|nr:hypothetical protein [bacterium]MBU1957851.1 hypothetical protein [bacterium]
MKQKLNNLKNNPEFQDKLQQMKPSRSILGVLGVILVFFVPEIMSYFYSVEINHWVVELAQTASSENIGNLLEWSTQKLFTGEVSWINIGLGVAFMVWLFRK